MEAFQVAAALVLLAGNFFFVAVEFAITNARPTMVDELVEKGVTGARSFKHGVDHIDNYLSACQLGITICSIGLGITAEPLVKEALESLLGEGNVAGIASTTVSFILAYAIVSMFHVVLGELTPKSLAIGRTRKTGLVLVPPMRVFYLATKPVVDLFNWMGNIVLKPFGIPPASEAGVEPHSEAELQSVMAESERSGMLEPEEQAFAAGAFTFGDRRARDVMVPRAGVATLSADQDVREAARHAAEAGHRRLPLCRSETGLDGAIGVVNLIDLVRSLATDGETDLGELARPLLETSEATRLDDLLEDLRARHDHMALIRDEHGTAVGIVTLEDIIEQVVGDIRDEFDPSAEAPIERSNDGYRVSGRTRVHQVARDLGLKPGDHREATIGGYVIERLGYVPNVGEEIEIDGARFQVAGVDGALVTEVLIRRAESGTEADEES